MAERSWRLLIDWCERPISANAWSGSNRWRKAELVGEWNSHAIHAARLAGLPRGLTGFKADIQFRYASGQLTDADSAAPTWKAVCDGLVTYGVTPDDTAEWFHGVTLHPPYIDRDLPHAVIVVITEVEEGRCPTYL